MSKPLVEVQLDGEPVAHFSQAGKQPLPMGYRMSQTADRPKV